MNTSHGSHNMLPRQGRESMTSGRWISFLLLL